MTHSKYTNFTLLRYGEPSAQAEFSYDLCVIVGSLANDDASVLDAELLDKGTLVRGHLTIVAHEPEFIGSIRPIKPVAKPSDG